MSNAVSSAEPSQVEIKLLELLDTLFKISLTVADFQPDSNAILQKRINRVASQLSDLNSLKETLDLKVPMNVLDYIDDGKNPDLYTKELVQLLVDKNQKTKGRVDAIQTLRNDLGKELRRNYPELLEEYMKEVPEPQEGVEPQGLDALKARGADTVM
ncbi:hypothetical protein HDV05_007515 [Chytridiales sp. JEL 0842]|nr:hypothetical protein HDV05_007515 [Chytridiales sp. JEL 0842]